MPFKTIEVRTPSLPEILNLIGAAPIPFAALNRPLTPNEAKRSTLITGQLAQAIEPLESLDLILDWVRRRILGYAVQCVFGQRVRDDLLEFIVLFKTEQECKRFKAEEDYLTNSRNSCSRRIS